MKTNIIKLIAGLAVGATLVNSTKAADVVRADTADTLNIGTAWVLGTPPTSADVAVFNSNILANFASSLGVDTNYAGLRIANPAGDITISGSTLTLGSSGVNMSAATTNLTLSTGVSLAAVQTWNVASGLFLTNSGVISGTSPLIRSGAGTHTLSLAGNTYSGGTTNDGSLVVVNTSVTPGHFGSNAVTIINNGTVQLWSGNNTADPGAAVGGSFTNAVVIPAGQTANIRHSWRGSISGPVTGSGTLNLRVTGVRGDLSGAWNGFTGQINVTSLTAAGDMRIAIAGNTNANFATTKINLGTGTFMYLSVNPPNGGVTASTSFQQIGELAGNSGATVLGNPVALRFVNWFVGGLNTDATFAGRIGDNAGASRISKAGTGNWTLSGNNNFTGSSAVLAGKLTGATGGSCSNTAAILVSSGATLAIAVTPAGNQWVGNNITNLAGSTLEFNYGGAVPSTTLAPLLCRSNLATTTTTSVRVVGGNWTVGVYPLAKYTGVLGGTGFAGYSLTTLPARVGGLLSNDTVNAQIVLVVTNVTSPLSWATGNGTWDTATANWVDTTAAAATYTETSGFGDSVQFEDTFSVGAGPLTVTLNSSVVPTGVKANSSKNFTISGAGSIGGVASLTKQNSGTLTLSTANSFTGGANINGGVVAFSVLNNLGSSANAISLGGGTLRYAGANTSDISAGRTVTLAAGSSTIDVVANNVTYSAAIGNNGAGGLTKTGSGTLTLNGANRFSGATTISQATLTLASGASITNSTSIVVGSGTVFDVSASGIVLNGAVGQTLTGPGNVNGTVTSGTGSFLAPGTSPGTLTISNVTMNGGTYIYDVSTNSGRDLIIVNGGLTLTSGTVQVNVTGSLTNGRYTVFQYTGALIGAAGNLVVTGFSQAGKLASLSSSIAGQIDLVISTAGGASITWAGVGTDWDVETSFNWNGGAAQFVNGDLVTFNDSGAGVQSVNFASALLPGSVTVNSTAATADYTFSTSAGGLLSGSAALTKSGSSTLTVLTTDNRTGSTTINAGTVQVGNGSSTGDLGSGNITNNAALVFQQTDNRTVVGAVRGTGTVAQNGTTVLTLSGATEYTGATAIGAGATLAVGSGGANGRLFTSAITDDGRLTLNSSTSWTNSAAISGLGEIVKTGTGTLTLNASNSYAGNTYVSNGVVKIAASERVPSGDGISGWLVLDAGAASAGTFDLSGFNETVNGLQGLGGTVQGRVINSQTATASTLTVSNEVATGYAGLILDNNGTGGTVALVKQGSAQLNLTGLNSYSGGTIVKGGTLAVGSGGQVGTGGIVLSNGTTFNMSANTPSVFPGNTITIAAGGTGAFASANAANGIGGDIVSGDANSTNSIVGPISIGSATVKQYQGFNGTVQVEVVGGIRFSSTGLNINGSDNTTFVNLGTINTRNGSAGANNGVYLGALFGNGILSAGGSGAGTSTYIIGTKNIDSTFSGQVTGSGANNTIIVKSGTGTLTLDGTLSYEGGTVVSNGVLAIAGSATLDTCTNLIIRSGAKLDVSTAGVLNLGSGAAQALSGSGTVWGSVFATGGGVATINPGDSTGTLTVTNALTLAANTVVNMELNRTNAQNADRINAATYVGGGAVVNVTNRGPTLLSGSIYQLFGGAVTGLGAVNLPATSADGSITYVWANNIAGNGTITLISGLNPNPAPITTVVTGSTLELNWPADRKGWTLQAQTNSLNIGISATWFNVAGSTATNQMFMPIVPGNPTVFYRLTLALP